MRKTGNGEGGQQVREILNCGAGGGPGVRIMHCFPPVEDPSSSPGLMWGDSHPSVTPAPGNPTTSSELQRHLHSCAPPPPN